MIIFALLCIVSKSQCINASCHHALCRVIIMNTMIQSYFVIRARKLLKLNGEEVATFLGLWLL
jgi:hypothetical protein